MIGGWGCSTGKSFRFVRAGVRAVWLPSGIGSQIPLAGLFPFPFLPWGALPFPFLPWGAFPCRFPHPQTSYPTLVGLIGISRLRPCRRPLGCWPAYFFEVGFCFPKACPCAGCVPYVSFQALFSNQCDLRSGCN